MITLTKVSTLVFVIVVLTLLSGCVLSNTQTHNFTPSALTMTEMVKVSPTNILTNTPASSITLGPTSITTTNTPIPTVTPVSTLSTDEAYIRMKKLLNNSEDCRLPCWWEIRAGKSTLLDVQEQLTMFSEIAEELRFPNMVKRKTLDKSGTYQDGAMYIINKLDTVTIQMFLHYFLHNDFEEITLINIKTKAYTETNDGLEILFGHEAYNEYFENYTLSGILSNYGIPNQIFMTANIRFPGLDGELYPTDTFQVWLFYPKLGIFARYTMAVGSSGDNYIICPEKSFVELWLTPSDQDFDYQAILPSLSYDWQGFFPSTEYNKPLDEALNMTIEEFYQRFRFPTDYCLETPKSIWPER